MVEKIKRVSNPLTIIAIFAGIAEISGTIVLPLIAVDVQRFYVWFLMLFPLYLVTLFFATLLFRHRVLYAPSDYRSDDAFFRSATPDEKRQKFVEEVLEFAEPKPPKQWGRATTANRPDPKSLDETDEIWAELITRAKTARQYILKEVQGQNPGADIDINTVLQEPTGSVSFDLIVQRQTEIKGFEVVFLRSPELSDYFFSELDKKVGALERFASRSLFFKKKVSLTLVLVTTFDNEVLQRFAEKTKTKINILDLDVDLIAYTFDDLEKKYAPRSEDSKNS